MKSRRWLQEVVVIFVITAGIIWLVANSRIDGWDFRNNLWAPSYLLLQGESPYDISSLYERGNPVWLPMAIGSFFPLGILPLPQAAMVWRLSSIGVMVGLVWLVAEEKRPSIFIFAIGVLAIALYPRTIAHIQLGQFSLLATFLYLLAVVLMQRHRSWLAALLVAVALAKPQLGLLAAMGLVIMAYHQQKLWGATWFVLAVGMWCGVLTLPLFLLYPNWVPDFITALQQNPVWVQPSLFSLLPAWLGWPGWVIWGILFGGVAVVNGWLWWRRPGLVAMLGSLALTPLVSPYIWSWDFVLLLPLFVWALFRVRRLEAHGLLWVGYLLNWGLMLWVVLHTDGSDHYFWWGSWLLAGVIMVALAWQKHYGLALNHVEDGIRGG